MKKHTFGIAIFSVIAAVLIATLTGCGHNCVTYGDGFKVETQINPENWALGFICQYGKILSVCVRENTEIEMQGAGSGNAGTGDGANSTGASSTGSVKIKIGRQTTGYTVDAIKAGAKPEEIYKYAE